MKRQEPRDKLKMRRSGTSIFMSWLSEAKLLDALRKRASESIADFTALKSKGVIFSPFLEMGGGRCQSAMVLTNLFDATGFCADISFDSLKTTKCLRQQLGMKKMPMRVCCDAYNLPFRNGAFSFVYCYRFLHHLPDPTLVLKEIKRVLKDGAFFFFANEPVKWRYKPNLVRRHPKPTSLTVRALSKLQILSFISAPDLGVFETAFDLHQWVNFLSVFEEKEIVLSTLKQKISSDFSRIEGKMLLFSLVGGSLRGLCKVKRE